GVEHVWADRQRRTAVVLFAHAVEARRCSLMTARAVAAEPIDDVVLAPLLDHSPVRGDREEEELPVACRRAEALLALHHRFLRDELDDRAHGVLASPGGVGDGARVVAVSQ